MPRDLAESNTSVQAESVGCRFPDHRTSIPCLTTEKLEPVNWGWRIYSLFWREAGFMASVILPSAPSESRPGRFGIYGGRYVPETLMAALLELEREYETGEGRCGVPDGAG